MKIAGATTVLILLLAKVPETVRRGCHPRLAAVFSVEYKNETKTGRTEMPACFSSLRSRQLSPHSEDRLQTAGSRGTQPPPIRFRAGQSTTCRHTRRAAGIEPGDTRAAPGRRRDREQRAECCAKGHNCSNTRASRSRAAVPQSIPGSGNYF